MKIDTNARALPTVGAKGPKRYEVEDAPANALPQKIRRAPGALWKRFSGYPTRGLTVNQKNKPFTGSFKKKKIQAGSAGAIKFQINPRHCAAV